MSNLIIFDIDGTLIDYVGCEEKAYSDAVNSITGIKQIDTDWNSYIHSTDAGILSEIIQSAFNRAPEPNETQAVKSKFVSYLKHEFQFNPLSCQCIPGAKTIFDKIREINWDIAIATGAWEEPALMKLSKAKIPYHGVPIAHSDDHEDRRGIIIEATIRAKRIYKKNVYQNVIYIGDALWDLNAAQGLNINFVGIGNRFDDLKRDDFYRIKNYEDCNLLTHLQTFAT